MTISLITLFTLFSYQSCNHDVDSEPLDGPSENFKIALENLALKVEILQPEINRVFGNPKNVKGYKSEMNDPVSEEEAARLFEPLFEPSVEILNEYGFTDQDYLEMFDTDNLSEVQPAVTQLGVILYEIEIGTYTNGSSHSTDADPWSPERIIPCLGEALGFSAIADAWTTRSLSSYAARKALLKAVGKAAARAGLGMIGVAIVVGDFAYCLGRD